MYCILSGSKRLLGGTAWYINCDFADTYLSLHVALCHYFAYAGVSFLHCLSQDTVSSTFLSITPSLLLPDWLLCSHAPPPMRRRKPFRRLCAAWADGV
jgi:hypothetical protein